MSIEVSRAASLFASSAQRLHSRAFANITRPLKASHNVASGTALGYFDPRRIFKSHETQEKRNLFCTRFRGKGIDLCQLNAALLLATANEMIE
jgi:hypothetical protein